MQGLEEIFILFTEKNKLKNMAFCFYKKVELHIMHYVFIYLILFEYSLEKRALY